MWLHREGPREVSDAALATPTGLTEELGQSVE